MSRHSRCLVRRRHGSPSVSIQYFMLVREANSDYSYDCNGTPAQNWVIERGSTSVKANGTNFCLDAGSSAFVRLP